MVQGTAELHPEIADSLFPQTDAVFHDAAALDTAIDVLDPEPPLVERLVGQVLLPRELMTTGFLGRHEDLHFRERERQEAQILQQPTPGRERVGSGFRNAQIMGTAAIGIAQKEDREEGIDEQDIFGSLVIPGVYIPLRNKGNTVSKGDRRMCRSGPWATLHILQ